MLAQLYDRGAIGVGREFVNAGITGESFVGRVEGETRLGDRPAVVTSVGGRAFVTGYSTLRRRRARPAGRGLPAALALLVGQRGGGRVFGLGGLKRGTRFAQEFLELGCINVVEP